MFEEKKTSKTTKKWMIIAGTMLVTGILVFVAVMTVLRWDFGKLSDVRYETNTFEVGESFDKLLIDTEADDISFVPSADKSCKVVCFEKEERKHTVAVKNRTLEIRLEKKKKWFGEISFSFNESPKITVYLPKESYQSLLIDASTGDIEIPKDFSFDSIDITASTGDVKCNASTKSLTRIEVSTGGIHLQDVASGSFDLSATTGGVEVSSADCRGDFAVGVSTGDAELKDITCGKLTASGSTSDFHFENVIASGSFSITCSTGGVTLDGCDASDFLINTSTGDVTGTLLSEKIFVTDTSTGNVDVPKTSSGGRCEINTTTGDIKLSIKK